jgi:hypothetical protein
MLMVLPETAVTVPVVVAVRTTMFTLVAATVLTVLSQVPATVTFEPTATSAMPLESTAPFLLNTVVLSVLTVWLPRALDWSVKLDPFTAVTLPVNVLVAGTLWLVVLVPLVPMR